MTTEITLIVAVDKNNVIGDGKSIPWMGKMKADMRRFKSLTMGYPVIMGRVTYETIGKPLPGRKNIVLTKNKHLRIPDVFVANDVNRVFELIKQSEKAYVLGGAEVYNLFLPYAHKIELTRIHASFKGTKRFPELSHHLFGQPDRIEQHKKDAENAYDYDFVTYTFVPDGDGSPSMAHV